MQRLLLAPLVGVMVMVAVVLPIEGSSGPAAAAATLDSEEQLFVNLINQYRQQNGLSPLAINAQLQDSTGWMSTDMGVHDYFSHCDLYGTGPGPAPCPTTCVNPCRDPFQRMSDFGYNYNAWKGENLAAGTSSGQAAFDAWKNSPGHNANMLSPDYTVMGIARTDTAGSSHGWYWTNDFGGYDPNPSTDSDGDGVPDAIDNCPTVENGPSQTGIASVGNQTNTDVLNEADGFRLGRGSPPPMIAADLQGDACDLDDDNDGFKDTDEQRIYAVNPGSAQTGTPCRTSAVTDPWPVDFRPSTPNRIVDTSEVSFILGFVGKAPASPGYSVRLDLVTDNPNDPVAAGVIDTREVSLILGFVGLACVSP